MQGHRKIVISNKRGCESPFSKFAGDFYLKHFTISIVFILFSTLLWSNTFNITGYLPSYRLESSIGAAGSSVLDLTGYHPDFESRRIITLSNLENNYDSFPFGYGMQSIEYWYGTNVDRIIYFSIKPGENGTLDLSEVKERDLARLNNMKQVFGTELTIAVSGSSSVFTPMANAEVLRKSFLNSLLQFCLINGFSGIDFDWEFPRTDEDIVNFSLLIEEAKQIFSAENIEISAAVSRYRLLSQDIYDNLDSINLMAYDFYGRHSTFESAVEATEYLQIKYNISPEKINLGIPFYGRIFSGLDPQYWTKSMIYRDILDEYEIQPDQDEAGGFYYNGIDTVKKKTNYAIEKNLGGIMIWELGQDSHDEYSLLKAIGEEIQ